MILLEDTISIGRITRTHGRQGEIQCLTTNECWEEAEADFLILNLHNILVPFRVLDWRSKGSDSLIFQLDGIDSEEKALPLVDTDARMLRRDIGHHQEEEDMLTWQDLIGYKVLSSDETDMGTITCVDETTINTLATTDQQKLLPLHEDLILLLDTENKILQLNLPSSL